MQASPRLARSIGLAVAIGAVVAPAGAQLAPVQFRAANPGEVPVDTKRMFESLSGDTPLHYGGGNNVAELSSAFGIASNFIVGMRPWQVYEPQNVTCQLVVQLDMDGNGLWDRYAILPGPGRPGYNASALITHAWQYPEPTYPSMGSHNIRWRIQERAPIGSYCSQQVTTVTTGYVPIHTLPTPSTALGASDIHIETSPPTSEPSTLVGYRSLDGVLDRLLVVVEGLDATNTTYPAKYLGMLLTRPDGTQPSMMDALLAQGFDVYVLNLGDANRNIRDSAMVLLGALLELRDRLAADCLPPGCDPRPIRVLGISMGGVLARYALAWAEQNGIDHGCDMFVSFDAPQQGAWANVDFQQWLYYNAGSNATMAMLADLIDNPAALELLTFNIFDPVQTLPAPHPPSIQQEFLAEINALNGGGYPRRTHNIGVSNGYADLVERTVQPLYSSTIVGSLAIATYTVWVNGFVFSQRVVRFEGGDIQGGSLQPSFKPSNLEGVVFSFDGKFMFFPVADPLEIRYSVDIGTWGAPAFIPVRSALDLQGVESSGPYDESIIGWQSSAFDEIYAPSDRAYWHDEIPPQTAAYLIGKLSEGPQYTSVNGVPHHDMPAKTFLWARQASSGESLVHFGLASPGEVDLSIVDVRGRLVRSVDRGALQAGSHTRTWDSRDGRGARVARGVYVVRLLAAGERLSQKIVVTR